jgi:uncharacterized protein (DUF111 family)
MHAVLEPHCGVSGDMLLGAQLDLGASRARLEPLERFEGLGVAGTEIRIAKTVKQGLSAHLRRCAPEGALPRPIGRRTSGASGCRGHLR